MPFPCSFFSALPSPLSRSHTHKPTTGGQSPADSQRAGPWPTPPPAVHRRCRLLLVLPEPMLATPSPPLFCSPSLPKQATGPPSLQQLTAITATGHLWRRPRRGRRHCWAVSVPHAAAPACFAPLFACIARSPVISQRRRCSIPHRRRRRPSTPYWSRHHPLLYLAWLSNWEGEKPKSHALDFELFWVN